jgi:hypothetical protein
VYVCVINSELQFFLSLAVIVHTAARVAPTCVSSHLRREVFCFQSFDVHCSSVSSQFHLCMR